MTGLTASIQVPAGKIMIACSLMLVAIVLLSAGIAIYRRWWRLRSAQSHASPWSLDDLQKMRDRGQVSQEEYQAARDSLIRAFQGDQGPSRPPREPEWDWVVDSARNGDSSEKSPDFDL